MAWVHFLDQGGSQINPFEWREIAVAQMQYGSDRSVEDVVAEQRSSRERRMRPVTRGNTKPVAPELSTPRPSEMAKLTEMLAGAKPRRKHTEE